MKIILKISKLVQLPIVLLALFAFSSNGFAESQRMFNIKTAPISDAIGIINVEGDIRIAERFTLGPSYSGFDFEYKDITLDSDAFGVRVNYYINRKALEGGWIVSLSGSYGKFKISKTEDNIDYSTTSSTRLYTALVSYQTMWDHFNMTFGLGASYFSVPKTVVGVAGTDAIDIDTSFLSGAFPNAEFTLGWAF